MIRSRIVKFIRRTGNVLLRPTGLTIGGRNPRAGEIIPLAALSQEEAADHLRWLRDKLGFAPSCLVDLGASDGRWTRPVQKLFPLATILMIEPQQTHQESLSRMTAQFTGLHYEICVVGETEREVELLCHGHQTSLYGDSEGRPFGNAVKVPMRTLDSLIGQHGLPWPDLIKMDIQGAELRALQGAEESLKHAQFVQAEFSLLPVQKDIPILDDLVVYLSLRGFRLFNVYGICGRPLDGMPAQGEALFIKKDSPLVTDYRWSSSSPWS